MSARRDTSQGFAFILDNGKETSVSAELAHTKVYRQFMEEAAEPTAPASPQGEVGEELEIIFLDGLRHLQDGVDPSTVMNWTAEDLMKLSKKVRGA